MKKGFLLNPKIEQTNKPARGWTKESNNPIKTVEKNILVGGVSLSNINRGITQSCSLGYWIGEKFASQGYMTESVAVSAGIVFNILKLHRLEAACIPENTASRKVLKKVGFTEEGYARKYLQINGEWKVKRMDLHFFWPERHIAEDFSTKFL